MSVFPSTASRVEVTLSEKTTRGHFLDFASLITPKKFTFFSTDSEKTLLGAEPVGCLLKNEKKRTYRTFGYIEPRGFRFLKVCNKSPFGSLFSFLFSTGLALSLGSIYKTVLKRNNEPTLPCRACPDLLRYVVTH
jgi:hypothetical protein